MQPYYQDSLVTLYHGDCREILPSLIGIDLICTDPPYGVNLNTAYRDSQRGVLAGANNYPRVFGDDRPFHPTQKPVALMAWCLSFFPGATLVCDPYAGSGSTLRACKDRSLPCIGIEIEERYCEIAAERCRQEVLELGA